MATYSCVCGQCTAFIYCSDECKIIQDEGYQAQYQKKKLTDNPYSEDKSAHWEWRKGFLEAFQDSKGYSYE